MFKALEGRRREQERFIEMARAYADKLRGRLGRLTAIVYGSVARGDFNLGSDADVLIVSDGLPFHPFGANGNTFLLSRTTFGTKGLCM